MNHYRGTMYLVFTYDGCSQPSVSIHNDRATAMTFRAKQLDTYRKVEIAKYTEVEDD